MDSNSLTRSPNILSTTWYYVWWSEVELPFPELLDPGCNYMETITRDTVLVITLDVLKTCHTRRKHDLLLSSSKIDYKSNIVNIQLDTWHQSIEKNIYRVTEHFAPGSGPILRCCICQVILTELYRNNFNLNNLKAVNTICHIWTWIRITARLAYSILETHSSLWVI